MKPLRLTVPAADGHALTAYCFEPARPALAGLVIAPAMAVQQSFYAPFAAFLASQGYRVWTFDYRGIGESSQGSMRHCKADVATWISADFDAVVQHASASMAEKPLFVLGHSLGGLSAPMLPSLERVSGIINIAVGSGHAQYMRPRIRRLYPLLWHVMAPVFCTTFGYFPGARIGVMGDIPRKALFQWRRWCLHPEYLLGAEPAARAGFAAIRCPLLSLVPADDELLLETGARWLHNAYTGTKVDYRVLNAKQLNSPRIGHFGFFKQQQEKILWPMVSEWLQQQSGAVYETYEADNAKCA